MREVHVSYRRAHGSTHPDSLGTQRELATLLHGIGKVEEAEELAREAVILSADTHGVEHPSTRASETLLAECLRAQGRVHESLPLLRQLHGDRHPRTISALCAGADEMVTHGRVAEAEALAREAWETSQTVLGDRHPFALIARTQLASVLRSIGGHDKDAEADALVASA